MNDNRVNLKSKIFANTFKHSVKDNLDSYDFVKRLMTTKEFEFRVTSDDCFEWADDAVLYYNITHNYKPFKHGKTLDEYIMWFIGYLYKYWMLTRNETPNEVYKQLPLKDAVQWFNFYHTQDWDYIINDVKGRKQK